MNEFLRLVLVILPGFVLTGSVVAVGWEYSKAWRMDRRIAKVTGRRSMGILPRHVTLISISYLLAVTFIIAASIINIHGRISWLTFVAGGMFYTGLFAMLGMVKFERKRHTDALP